MLTDCMKYANLFVINAKKGSFLSKTTSESSRLVQGCVVGCVCRPGARFLNRWKNDRVIANQSADWCGNLLAF